jgi:hypothetical protein
MSYWGCHWVRSAIPTLTIGLNFAAVASPETPSPLAMVQPVTDDNLLHPNDADWLMWRRTGRLGI